jgi:hypothetical protein
MDGGGLWEGSGCGQQSHGLATREWTSPRHTLNCPAAAFEFERHARRRPCNTPPPESQGRLAAHLLAALSCSSSNLGRNS